METVELLRNLRQIMREKMTLAIEPQMNSHFDRLETLFKDLFARLDGINRHSFHSEPTSIASEQRPHRQLSTPITSNRA